MKKMLLISVLCLMPSAQAIDYVQCEAIQRAAARLKSAMDAEALAAQNAIILSNGEGSGYMHEKFR